MLKLSLLMLTMTALPALAAGRETHPPHRSLGIERAALAPRFWVDRLETPDRVVLDHAAIEAQNAKLLQLDPSMHDLRMLPSTLARKRVRGWIEALADAPDDTLYDAAGAPLPAERLDDIVSNRAIDTIPERQATRYGLVVHRAALRTFPTRQRVFSSPDNSDIDRFQESALFPGTPVAIAHESRDGRWWFVVAPRYAAWIEKRYVAEGPAAEVFGYRGKAPYRVVTGATVDTVFTPERPALSELQLDMGVRVPLAAEHFEAVNGEYPYTSWVIELPMRAPEGRLRLAPVLLQRNTDTAGDYLPLTRANIVRQGFKFLGERYGWGHSYNARDCSGFVSEVYRSMGVMLPRNTSDQSVSPALNKRVFERGDGTEARLAAVRTLEVGDLVYIPGHVMMVIGWLDGEPWVIHDTTGASYLDAGGSMARIHLNAVSVTPLMPLRFNENERYVDRLTSIVRIRPNTAKEAQVSP